MMNPRVSVIIVCMNRPDNLYPCLDSITVNTSCRYEVIVTAYRFSKDNLEQARQRYPWVTFIPSNEVRGFSENNNLALEHAKGEFCLILNDDTVFMNDVIDRLLNDFEHLKPKTAIVSPTLYNEDGSIQMRGRGRQCGIGYVLKRWHLYREKADRAAGATPEWGEACRTRSVTGAAFMIRTSVFRDIGWFDERYFFTPEDIDIARKVRKRGLRIYVDRAAELVHKYRGTTAGRMDPSVRPAAVRGSLIFFSGGSTFRYALLALPVWVAETAKRIKAAFRFLKDRSGTNRIALRTYRNISRNIFTCKTPKEIFIKLNGKDF